MENGALEEKHPHCIQAATNLKCKKTPWKLSTKWNKKINPWRISLFLTLSPTIFLFPFAFHLIFVQFSLNELTTERNAHHFSFRSIFLCRLTNKGIDPKGLLQYWLKLQKQSGLPEQRQLWSSISDGVRVFGPNRFTSTSHRKQHRGISSWATLWLRPTLRDSMCWTLWIRWRTRRF